ncbi:MAG: hypothetical protein ACTTKH_03565 [Treponema sp.]
MYFKWSFFLVFSFLSFNAFADFEKPRLIYPEVILPSSAGFGGNYSTYYKDDSILFSNPALFAFAEKRSSAMSLNFRIDSLAYSALKYIRSKDRQSNLLNLLTNTSSLCTNAALTGPISFSFIDKNFGFGMFNTTRAIALLPSLSSIFSLIGEDVVITGGYGATVFEKENHLISLGVQMKGFFQTYVYINSTLFGSVYTIFEKQLKGLPVVLQAGFGFDLGFAYKYKNILTVGLTCKDLYSPVFLSYYENYTDFFNSKPKDKSTYKTFTPTINLGLSVQAIHPGYFKNVCSLNFYMDLRNMFSFIPSIRKNYLLNFAFGGELVFHRVLSVRFGIQELYPQFGIGLDFTYFDLSFSVYGKELALDPWKRPLINIEIGIRFDI